MEIGKFIRESKSLGLVHFYSLLECVRMQMCRDDGNIPVRTTVKYISNLGRSWTFAGAMQGSQCKYVSWWYSGKK